MNAQMRAETALAHLRDYKVASGPTERMVYVYPAGDDEMITAIVIDTMARAGFGFVVAHVDPKYGLYFRFVLSEKLLPKQDVFR